MSFLSLCILRYLNSRKFFVLEQVRLQKFRMSDCSVLCNLTLQLLIQLSGWTLKGSVDRLIGLKLAAQQCVWPMQLFKKIN